MKNYTTVNVVLADDHEIYRDGFSVMLSKLSNIHLIGEASNGKELITLARALKPDVIITDIKMPILDGIEATKQLVQEFPTLGIIALSMYDEENLIIDMLEAGAKGYLLKNASKEEIISAITTVYNDQSYYCHSTTSKLAHMIANSSYNPYKKIPKPSLNEKELSVIKLICEEHYTKEIAGILHLSHRTVEGYREKILKKLDAKNSAGIVIYALKHKIYQHK